MRVVHNYSPFTQAFINKNLNSIRQYNNTLFAYCDYVRKKKISAKFRLKSRDQSLSEKLVSGISLL